MLNFLSRQLTRLRAHNADYIRRCGDADDSPSYFTIEAEIAIVVFVLGLGVCAAGVLYYIGAI